MTGRLWTVQSSSYLCGLFLRLRLEKLWLIDKGRLRVGNRKLFNREKKKVK